MARSQNGYPVPPPSTRKWLVPGTKRHFVLVDGWGGFLLTCFATYWHEQVEAIDKGQWDEWGGANRKVRGSSTVISNHASFTAIDVNATQYPLGLRRMPLSKKVKLRAYAATMLGAIRLGLDYANRADEMHAELNKGQKVVNAVGRAIAKTAIGRRVLAANPAFARAKGISLKKPAPVRKPKSAHKPTGDVDGRFVNVVGKVKKGQHGNFRSRPTSANPVGKVLSVHRAGSRFRFDRELKVGDITWLRLKQNPKKWMNKAVLV